MWKWVSILCGCCTGFLFQLFTQSRKLLCYYSLLPCHIIWLAAVMGTVRNSAPNLGKRDNNKVKINICRIFPYYTRLEKFHDINLLKTVNIKPLMRKILVQLPTNCTFLDFRKSYRVIPPWLLQQLYSSFSYMKRKLHCLRKMMEKIFCWSCLI